MTNNISRRYFFYGALLTGAVPVGGYGSVTSLRALGYKPFYNKLQVASIGCGGQGGVILNQAAQTETIVALCDVDLDRAAPNLKRFEKLPLYRDFRVLLDKEDKNIDALTIAIPGLYARHGGLGLHATGQARVSGETVDADGLGSALLADAAVKYKVATQMGNQGFSHESHRVAAEILWSGEIGDVTEVHVSVTPGTHPTGLQALPKEESAPASLDWQAWLGNAPMRPFSSDYVPYNWRGFYDFGTGQIGNWATHTAGPVHHALQLGAPTSVECVSQMKPSKLTFPDRAVIRLDFPARGGMPPVKVFYHDSSRPSDPDAYRVPGMENEVILPPANNLVEKGRGSRPQTAAAAPKAAPNPNAPRQGAGGPGVKVFGPEREAVRRGILTGNGAVFLGSKGVMATMERGEGVWLLPSARWAEYQLPPQVLTRSPGHMADWVRACKGGDRSCSDFSITGPYAEWLALAALAFRVPGKLDWDSKALRFTNSVEANKLVKPVVRPGWELKL